MAWLEGHPSGLLSLILGVREGQILTGAFPGGEGAWPAQPGDRGPWPSTAPILGVSLPALRGGPALDTTGPVLRVPPTARAVCLAPQRAPAPPPGRPWHQRGQAGQRPGPRRRPPRLPGSRTSAPSGHPCLAWGDSREQALGPSHHHHLLFPVHCLPAAPCLAAGPTPGRGQWGASAVPLGVSMWPWGEGVREGASGLWGGPRGGVGGWAPTTRVWCGRRGQVLREGTDWLGPVAGRLARPRYSQVTS